ncbi:hypothetical protein ACIRD6_30615 [Streptomyces sp. NPDC102473]|uniref:hypothetical protein n=1 Tax=unclassified Streptomyces TaxID=2593676 RepID=UPI0038044480
MLTGRYDDAPLDAGEALLARPGFWSNHLSAVCADGAGDVRPVPEWFGEDTADADALSDILFDPARWPVFRLPGADGSEVVVVFRNLVGDHGTDFLLVPPGRSRAQQIATGEEELSARGLTWRELVRIADSPAPEAGGIDDPAARLLLLLPLFNDLEVPEGAPARLSAALTAIGAAQHIAPSAAEHLLAGLSGRVWHDSAWRSPLSG